MLKLNVARVAQLRGIKKIYTYFFKLGFSRNVAQRIATSNMKVIHLEHLTKVCEELKCTPNDLLVWQGESNHLAEDHPLKSLIRDDNKYQNLDKIKHMSLTELEKLSEMIGEMK